MVGTSAIAQDLPLVHVTPNGTEPVVVEVPGKSASQIYISIRNWILQTNDNPKEILKAYIPNEMLRFRGYNESVWSHRLNGYGLAYTITINCQDGKYKYEFKNNGIFFPLYRQKNESIFFDKNGNVKEKYADGKAEYEAFINGLNQSIYDYIIGVRKDNG